MDLQDPSTGLYRCDRAPVLMVGVSFFYMRSLVKDKKWNLAKLLSRNSRYVDDLITLNYTNFGKLYSEIYPVGLLMERSGDNNRVVNYLDLNITFDERGTPITKLYNKQDSFNFAVVRYPFPSGNMPRLVGHNVFLWTSAALYRPLL